MTVNQGFEPPNNQKADSTQSVELQPSCYHSITLGHNKDWEIHTAYTCSVCPPVPAAVTDVRVSNNGRTNFLTVSWGQAAGEVDSYLVTLADQDRTLHTVAVSKSNPSCIFNSLVPGRLYNISITSCSGRYQNSTFIQERTRKLCCVLVQNSVLSFFL